MGERRVETLRREWGVVVRVRLPGGEVEYFAGFDRDSAQRRGLVVRALVDSIGKISITGRGVVPTPVVLRGRAWVAAYLFAAHLYSVDEVASMLEVEPGTVEQYISDVRTGRR